jgi:hypothetical protein
VSRAPFSHRTARALLPVIAGVFNGILDFAAIVDDLDFLKAQFARIPTWKELARIALGIIFGAAGLVIGWMAVRGYRLLADRPA